MLDSTKVILMDGAIGTELQRAELGEGECGELWNRTHPERVRAIHQRYLEAGARTLLTNTFQAHPQALARFGLEDRASDLIRAGIDLARSVASPETFVLGDLGPIPRTTRPDAVEQMIQGFRGADALLLETFSEPDDIAWILRAAQSVDPAGSLPVLISLTFLKTASGRLQTATGLSPEEALARIPSDQVAALGVNCGREIGMEEITAIVHRFHGVSDRPLFARPNAGTPVRSVSGWLYPHSPKAMAERLPELLQAGVRMVGGCCGTTPEHIRAFRPVVEAWNASHV
jgi:5-methyltetrahydrofolate--homocysteine methyltransferase